VVAVRVLTTALVLAWLLTGCVGQDAPAVFVGHDNSSAVLIQWTDAGNGVLSGSAQVADKSASSTGAAVKQTTLTFSGRLISNRVSLVVQPSPGRTQTWNGTLEDNELRVDLRAGVGGSETMILARASPATYNADVAALEAEVIQARSAAARAAAEAQDEATGADLDAATRRSFDDAVSDLSTSQETVLAMLLDPSELKALPAGLKAARRDLRAVKANADEAAQRPRGFVACEFASQAQGAAGDVQSDASFLTRNARSVSAAADDLADAREQLSAAYLRLQQLSEHGGQSSKSGSAAADALIDKARQTAREWRSTANRARKTMRSIVSEATTLADGAQSASC
jgi:hypothetical protein